MLAGKFQDWRTLCFFAKILLQMSYSQRTEHAIYVFFYKDVPMASLSPFYIPVMAGNALQKEITCYSGDDSGDHISDKNQYYSELTGIYWVWKNTDHKITGSCHYRRFFTAQPIPLFYRLKNKVLHPVSGKKSQGLWYIRYLKKHQNLILSEEETIRIMEQYDAILPVPRRFRYSVRDHYLRYHQEKDLILVREIISRHYPEYLVSFDLVMASRELYANNMFILRRPHFDNFMTWWFDILFRFEEQTDLKHYQGYQKRIFGFMAERLLTVWFRHQDLRIQELPVLYFKRLKYRKSRFLKPVASFKRK